MISSCDPRSRLSISSFHTLRNFCPSRSFDSGLIFINFTLGKADIMSAILKFISFDVAEMTKLLDVCCCSLGLSIH